MSSTATNTSILSLLHKRSFSRSCSIINHFKVFSCKEWLWYWKLMYTLLSCQLRRSVSSKRRKATPKANMVSQLPRRRKKVNHLLFSVIILSDDSASSNIWVCGLFNVSAALRLMAQIYFGESQTKLIRLRCELKEVAHYWHILMTGSYIVH